MILQRFSRALGSTSNILRVLIGATATSVPTGVGTTALTSASSGLSISTICDNEATPVLYTSAGSTIEAVTTLGTFAAPTATKCRFKKVDDTKHPGLYELQIDDARFTVAGAKNLHITITGVANTEDTNILVELETDVYVTKQAPTGANPAWR